MREMQSRATAVCADVFGKESMRNIRERRKRFAEEALELMQASGETLDEVIELARYVYALEPGEFSQEVAGTMLGLFGLASSRLVNVTHCVHTELNRLVDNKQAIRAKALLKPDFMVEVRSAAPESVA